MSEIDRIRTRITQSEPFRVLERELEALRPETPIPMQGISGSLMAFVAVHVFEKRQRQLLLVVPESDLAERLRDDCALLLGDSMVHLYASAPHHAARLLDMTAPIAQVEALRALSGGKCVVVVASAEALASLVMPPEQFKRRSLELAVNSEVAYEPLLQTLADLGFEKKEFVEEYGDFAVRGGILDVFPFVGDNPVRVEFWGDTIESIREFDVLSQRSIRELQTASIIPSLLSASDHPDIDAQGKLLFEYLHPDAVVMVCDPVLIRKEIDELRGEGVPHVAEWDTLEQALTHFSRLEHTVLVQHDSPPAVSFDSAPQPPCAGSVKTLLRHLDRLHADGYTTVIACDTKEEGDRLNELIEEELTVRTGDTGSNELPPPERQGCRIITDSLHAGFIDRASRVAFFTEHEIFGRLKRRGAARKRKFKGISHKELQQLQRGDFVVHVDHGIGKFAGLQKLKIQGSEQEVMKLVYQDNDVLYVNLNFVNRVQKYSSQEGHVPALSKLGGPDWDRLKARARKKIKDIARDLIKLYARRRHEQGFTFAPDTHWQKEMEASFLYEDTPDQAKATVDVKADMERPSPMDRLICGDVGFGKTEVAVRAAFKSVMSGKQVVVLVPTTILAQQHYNTFVDRLGRYSVRVESLTRFRTRKDQQQVLESLKSGGVDVLIGTHRLLSKDVAFKDLGLLVIDEEHRFGVSAKEKLRQLRVTVDTLTLTATPIPRTLQFSLMGARDLSLINTPPRNRLPIQTVIAQFDLQLIREAILKELHRGGQVYFVHDRVHNIDEVQALLEQNVPKARFHLAHGQMQGHELEKAMMDFLEKKYDVLLCTKIIESGIDIPSVNTIIINRADRFGLAELYQLRGRVGRSNVQAHAYLLTPPLSVLPRQTLRRLQAIQEFTELGSGFNLAMRDLEIRGAGNLLGAEQSGFILEMGFEMYQRIVEEAVQELKQHEFADVFEREVHGPPREAETVIETDIEALIPDFYIESDAERLDLYRRMYRMKQREELEALRAELTDRFGEYPEEVENLLQLIEVKIMAGAAGFVKVELSGNDLVLSFPPPEQQAFYDGEDSPFQTMMSRIHTLRGYQPRLTQEGTQVKLQSRIPAGDSVPDRLAEVKNLIRGLRDAGTS